MGNGLHVSTERTYDDSWKVTATGELDVATAGYFEAAMAQVVDSDLSLIEIDLSGLSFIGAEGARLLTEAMVACQAQGRTLIVVAVSSFVRRVFTLTGIIDRIERPPTPV